MAGTSKPRYRWPRKGEKRRRRQRFKAESLPAEVREKILALRARPRRYSWAHVSEDLKRETRTKISASALQRYYDVCIEQALADDRERARARDRVLAQWGSRYFKDFPEKLQGKLQDYLVDLSLSVSEKNLAGFEKGMLNIGWLIAQFQKNEVAKLRATTEQRKLEQVRHRGQKLAEQVERAAGKGKRIDLKKLAKRLREEVYGA